jgi:CHAD domain-containing protein
MSGDELKRLIEQSGYNHTYIAQLLGMSYQNLFKIYKREHIKSSKLDEILEKLNLVNKNVDTVDAEETPIEVIKELQERIRTLEDTIQDLRLNNKSLRNAVESLGESNKTFNQIIQKDFIKGKAS